jgi:outer membrane receptor for ferrienterochelin and colicins
MRLVVAARLFVAALVFTLSAAPAAPQARSESGSTVTGTVRDLSGAAIPRPLVVVRQEGSTFERVVDVSSGAFAVSRLDAGRYLVTASAPGFAAETAVVEVPASAPVELMLSPAPVVEQVTVVSASRQAELRDTLNTRVDVITRSRIEEGGGHETVGELLRELPGVVTRRGSETSGVAGEQIQGIESRQVLVLIDGQPIVGARGVKRGGIINLDRQSTARLERVEVVKGAASALYGSEALGGVINLISRQPDAPFDATVSLSGGSLGAIDTRLDTGFNRASTVGMVSVERHQKDGFDLTPATFDTTGAPFRRYDTLVKLQHRLSPGFSVGGLVTGYTNHLTGRSNGELGPQVDDVRERAVSVNLTANWLVGSDMTIDARGYVSSFVERSAGHLAPPRATPLAPGALDQDFRKADVAVARAIGTTQMLQFGGEWSRDFYKGINRVRDENGHEADTRVVWGQHRWSLSDRLTTTVGARVDSRSDFETAVSPKAALSARLADGLNARVSYGRGFRAPDLGQLYYRFLSPSNFYQVIGNPDLTPEYADSWQFGADYYFPKRRARLGINGFRNDVRDLIESTTVGFAATPAQMAALLAREGIDPSFAPALGRPVLTYRNLFDATTQGVEVDGEAAITGTVTVSGAYTYLSAVDHESDLALTGRHPHHGSLRLSWQPAASGFRASLRGTFYSSWIAQRATSATGVNDTIAPRFALWDAFISQRLGRGLSVLLSVDNIADSQDPNTGVMTAAGTPANIYRPEAGRTARIGVQWSFDAR